MYVISYVQRSRMMLGCNGALIYVARSIFSLLCCARLESALKSTVHPAQDMPDFLRSEMIISTDQRLNLVKLIADALARHTGADSLGAAK